MGINKHLHPVSSLEKEMVSIFFPCEYTMAAFDFLLICFSSSSSYPVQRGWSLSHLSHDERYALDALTLRLTANVNHQLTWHACVWMVGGSWLDSWLDEVNTAHPCRGPGGQADWDLFSSFSLYVTKLQQQSSRGQKPHNNIDIRNPTIQYEQEICNSRWK